MRRIYICLLTLALLVNLFTGRIQTVHAASMWQKITPDSFSSGDGVFTKVVGVDDLYLLYSSPEGKAIYSYTESGFSELPITSEFDPAFYTDIQGMAYANGLLFVGWETVEGIELWTFDGESWAMVEEPFITFATRIQLMDSFMGGTYLFIAITGSLGEEETMIGLAYDGEELIPLLSSESSGLGYDDLELVDITSYEGAIFGIVHSDTAGQDFVVGLWGEEWEPIGDPFTAELADIEIVVAAGIAVTSDGEEPLTLFMISGSDWMSIELPILEAVRGELVYNGETFYLGVSMSNEGSELAKIYDMSVELGDGHIVGGAWENISWIYSFELLGDNLVVAGAQRGDAGLIGGGVWLFDPAGDPVEEPDGDADEGEEEVDEEIDEEEPSEEDEDSQDGNNSGGSVSQTDTVDNDGTLGEESEEGESEEEEENPVNPPVDDSDSVSGSENNEEVSEGAPSFPWWAGVFGGVFVAAYLALKKKDFKK